MDHPTMPKLLLEHNEECIRELNAYIRRKNALLKEIQKSIAIIIHKQNRISEENQRISLDKRSISALFQEREMKAKTPEEKAEVLENKKRMKELYDFCEQNNDKEQAQNTQQSMDVLKKVDKVLKGAIQDNISLKIIKDEIKPILEPKRTVRWLNRY